MKNMLLSFGVCFGVVVALGLAFGVLFAVFAYESTWILILTGTAIGTLALFLVDRSNEK